MSGEPRPHGRPALIAGGGIAGLTTALALARRGIAARVFETRASPAAEGAGIQIGPNATRILIDLGLSDRLAAHITAPEAIAVRDGTTGRTLARLPLGATIARRHGAPYWVIHRAELYQALLEAAEAEPAIAIEPGRTVAEVLAAGRGVAVRFAEGGAAEGPLLVGADGLWSRLRTRLAPGAPLTATGVTAARTVIPIDAVPDALRAPVTGVWLAPQTHVVHYPVHGGRSLAVVAIAPGGEDGRGWNGHVAAEDVMARFGRLPAPLAQLFSQATAWRQWALMRGDAVFQPAVAAGDGDRAALPVVLMGDAAHPIQPFLAQGGAMAIEDGAVLADVLAEAGDETWSDSGDAIARFTQQRRRRVEAVQRASLENGRIYHLDGAVRAARNAVLRLTPGGLLMRRYDWLYGWRPAG